MKRFLSLLLLAVSASASIATSPPPGTMVEGQADPAWTGTGSAELETGLLNHQDVYVATATFAWVTPDSRGSLDVTVVPTILTGDDPTLLVTVRDEAGALLVATTMSDGTQTVRIPLAPESVERGSVEERSYEIEIEVLEHQVELKLDVIASLAAVRTGEETEAIEVTSAISGRLEGPGEDTGDAGDIGDTADTADTGDTGDTGE